MVHYIIGLIVFLVLFLLSPPLWLILTPLTIDGFKNHRQYYGTTDTVIFTSLFLVSFIFLVIFVTSFYDDHQFVISRSWINVLIPVLVWSYVSFHRKSTLERLSRKV